jgi:hypothetical protein
MKIEIGKKYTSNGENLRVVCIDRKSMLGYNVVGIFDHGSIRCFKADGESSLGPEYNLQEIWEPKAGEWCLFFDDENADHFVLAKFVEMTEDRNFCSYRLGIWAHCAKFDGTLPLHLKSSED